AALRDHPALFAWEIGNELKDLSDASGFVSFATGMAKRIRAADANHLVTTGIISTTNAGLRGAGDVSASTAAHALHAGADFDFLTVHAYDGATGDDDTDLAVAFGKPLVLEETGFSSGASRAARILASAR